MLISVTKRHRRIIYSLRGSSGRGLEDHFILSAHFTDEETDAQREEVIGGRGKKWHKEVGMGGLEEKSAGNFLVSEGFLTLQRFVLRLECVVPNSDPRGLWP